MRHNANSVTECGDLSITLNSGYFSALCAVYADVYILYACILVSPCILL